MSGLNPNRAVDFLAVQLQFDDIIGCQVQAVRHRGPDQNRIVPGHLGHGLGYFLQPPVVGELAVVDRWIATEVDLYALSCRGFG